MKLISVIIPCYNVENYIDRTLESLRAQSIGFDSLEIICIDDNSTDKTLERLKAWEKSYPTDMIVIALDKNGRQGAARNLGLSYASCDYIAFIDSDDWVEKNYFERMYNIATQGSYDLVQCEYVRDSAKDLSYNNDSVKSAIYKAPEEIRINSVADRQKTFHRKVITNTPPLKLIRRSVLTNNDVLFSEGIAYEDSYWGILLNMYINSACILHEPLYHYYINEKSTVLSKNELYHVDLLTNQILIWNELEKRGLMDSFRDEIEIEHVYSCALIFWKMIILRYDEPPYSLYRLLCAVIQDHIPNILDNPYIKNGELSELHLLLLQSCLNTMAKDDFVVFAHNVKTIGL